MNAMVPKKYYVSSLQIDITMVHLRISKCHVSPLLLILVNRAVVGDSYLANSNTIFLQSNYIPRIAIFDEYFHKFAFIIN